MAIKTLPGKGTLLQLQVAGVYYTVGQRVSIDGPKPSLKMRDITHLDSTFESSRPTIPNLGTLSGKLFYDPNDSTTTVNHPMLEGKITSPPSTPDTWKMAYNDGLTSPANDVFQGFLSKWEKSGFEVQGSVEVTYEITLTDSYTHTIGTP